MNYCVLGLEGKDYKVEDVKKVKVVENTLIVYGEEDLILFVSDLHSIKGIAKDGDK